MVRQRRAGGDGRLDDAARAGWLYYVAGNTQDEIAAKLGISRQSAQRLVSLAVSEGLVKVRLDHPLAKCLELATQLRERFGLTLCEVVPTDPASESSTLGVADAAAAEMERRLKAPETKVMAIGTGRTATAADVVEVHAEIRRLLVGLVGEGAQNVRILYGGSVKPDNAAELLSQANVDGALVGGASLKAEDFWAIAQSA